MVAGVAPATAADFIVKATTIPEMKAVFGLVESRIVVPARARIGGSVRELRISQGDEVKERQAVAVVVDDKLALQLGAANAKIEAFNSQLENAHLQFERAQQLRATGTGTQASLDQAKMQFDVATNQVAAARAETPQWFVIRDSNVLASNAGLSAWRRTIWPAIRAQARYEPVLSEAYDELDILPIK